MTCDRCYQPVHDETEHGIGLCPFEPRRLHLAVRQDSIEGGLVIEHGLCNEDGTPRRFDSRSEIRQACAVKGLIPWGEVYSEDRTKDARVHADWLQSGEAKRAKRERDEMRRAGVRIVPQSSAPRPQSTPEQRAYIRRIVAEKVAALR